MKTTTVDKRKNDNNVKYARQKHRFTGKLKRSTYIAAVKTMRNLIKRWIVATFISQLMEKTMLEEKRKKKQKDGERDGERCVSQESRRHLQGWKKNGFASVIKELLMHWYVCLLQAVHSSSTTKIIRQMSASWIAPHSRHHVLCVWTCKLCARRLTYPYNTCSVNKYT